MNRTAYPDRSLHTASSALVPADFLQSIFVAELRSRGIRYRGFLYAGVIVDKSGMVHVLEFNCRLGDPETQVLMARLESDLADVLVRAATGKLDGATLRWSRNSAAVVVMASEGYPATVKDGREISGLFEPAEDLIVFHAGTEKRGDRIFTKGGRVLGVTALGPSLNAALERVYIGVSKLHFEGAQFRRDIGRDR